MIRFRWRLFSKMDKPLIRECWKRREPIFPLVWFPHYVGGLLSIFVESFRGLDFGFDNLVLSHLKESRWDLINSSVEITWFVRSLLRICLAFCSSSVAWIFEPPWSRVSLLKTQTFLFVSHFVFHRFLYSLSSSDVCELLVAVSRISTIPPHGRVQFRFSCFRIRLYLCFRVVWNREWSSLVHFVWPVFHLVGRVSEISNGYDYSGIFCSSYFCQIGEALRSVYC